jgi:predicted transcriptional regulator
MNLTKKDLKFLEILSDGKKKTYVHIVKGFDMLLTPMAPTFTNKIAKRLLKLGLIKKAGILRDGYKITSKGFTALSKHGNSIV